MFSAVARAQTYPSRSVRLVVPYGPGTLSDSLSRQLAEQLSTRWKVGVVVENLTGAGGIIGTQAIAKAPADGYTIGMLASNHALNAALHASLPYDPLKDFTPLLHVSSNQFMLCVNSQVPAATLQEFLALAKAKPNELTYASSGNGGPTHLAVAKLAHMTSVRMLHVPYKSNGAGVNDLLGNQVSCMATSVSVLAPHVKTGKLKALAVLGDTRSPLIPEVPTAQEAGVAGYSMKNWNGIAAPAGLHPEIASQLQRELTEVLSQPAMRDKIAGMGAELELLDAKAFGERIRSEIVAWKQVVVATGAKVD